MDHHSNCTKLNTPFPCSGYYPSVHMKEHWQLCYKSAIQQISFNNMRANLTKKWLTKPSIMKQLMLPKTFPLGSLHMHQGIQQLFERTYYSRLLAVLLKARQGAKVSLRPKREAHALSTQGAYREN